MVAGWRAESHVGARPGARMRVRRTGGCTLSTSAAASTDPPRPTQPSAGRFWFFSHLKGHGPPLQGPKLRFGRGRRCKGISSAAWFRFLLQHAGAVHPCIARTKSPCSDVLRNRGVHRFDGHCLRAAGAGIDEATDIQIAKDAVVRGSGASRPWMACARLLEPGTAESGDAPDPRTAAAPPEASGLQCFSTWPDPT